MNENSRPEDQPLGEDDLEAAAGGGAGACDADPGSYGGHEASGAGTPEPPDFPGEIEFPGKHR